MNNQLDQWIFWLGVVSVLVGSVMIHPGLFTISLGVFLLRLSWERHEEEEDQRMLNERVNDYETPGQSFYDSETDGGGT